VTTPGHGDKPIPVGRVKDGTGQFIRTLRGVERDTEAARLRVRGLTWREISKQLGYASAANAQRGAMKVISEVPVEAVNELRAVSFERLESMRQAALRVLETRHVHISEGRVVRDRDPTTGEDRGPIEDDAPVLAAIDRLHKIEDRMSKLYGLDAPIKTEIVSPVRVHHIIEGVDIDKL
jgi:hypothetical protein